MDQKRRSIRQTVRTWALAVLILFVIPIIAAVVGEFFIELPKEYDAYKKPTDRLARTSAMLTGIVGSTWFVLIVAALSGFTGGVWLDWWLRRLDGKKSNGRQIGPTNIERLMLRERELERCLSEVRSCAHAAKSISNEIKSSLLTPMSFWENPNSATRKLSEFADELTKIDHHFRSVGQHDSNLSLRSGYLPSPHPIGGLDGMSDVQQAEIRHFWDRLMQFENVYPRPLSEVRKELGLLQEQLKRLGQIR